MVQLSEEDVPLEDLLLDPNNYRFQDELDFAAASEARFSEDTVQERAYQRLRRGGLTELKSSILTNGYLPFERIVVRPYGQKGKFVVVEGNRRVAALHWISEDHAAGIDIPEGLRKLLGAVPVTVVPEQEAQPALILSLMGVRHVGGIREWGGFQAAKLVTQLRDGHDLDTSEVAARLGMTAHEVNRRYRAYKALQQMMEDDEYGDQAQPVMYPLFHEAVAGTAIKDWLEWEDERSEFTSSENLRRFYDLITYHDDDEGTRTPPKLATREAVRAMREILPVPEARRALFDPDRTYQDALGIAKANELSKSWSAHVGEAVVALKSIGALELESFEKDEIAEITALRDLADSLLVLHSKLSS